MNNGLMKKVAMKAMSSLEGLDASNVKAVSIIFTSGNEKKGMHKMPDGSMMKDEDMEEEDYGEEESSGEYCKECGHKCKEGEEECPMCGADREEVKPSKSVKESYVEDEEDEEEEYSNVMNNKESKQLKSVRGK